MQRAGPSRGYSLSHQKVALEVDFGAAALAGYTELTIVPTDRALRVVHLNCRQAAIQRIYVGGTPAEYSFTDHLSGVSISDPTDVHLYPELKRKLYAAASDGAGGELSVLLPSELALEAAASDAAALDAPTPGGSAAHAEFAPLVVRIEYVLRDPVEAIQFVLPSQEHPYRVPHAYTAPTCPDWARCWVPCVDSLWERCTWELEFVVPRRLGAGDGPEDSSEVLVACTGDLVEQVAHPFNSSKSIFYYSQSVPTTIQHMAFAIGPFETHDMLAASDSAGLGAKTSATAAHAAQDGEAGQLQLLAFCLPGRLDELRASVATVRLAVDYYSRDFGSYPFSSLKLVFVDEPPADCHAASTLSLLSSDLLHAANVIEQALETRLVLHQTVAFQWFGINIIQRAWSDTWLVNGLSLHMAGLFLRKLMGQNEYRFRLKKDVDRLCAWDVGMPPMYQHGVGEPPDEALLPFINLKAPLVLYILDRRLCKAGASLGLGRVVPRVLLQALTGEMANNALSTHNFLRTCRKVSNVDLRTFTEQWIYGSGCPRFFVDAEFNRKKLIIEFHIRQESPAAIFAANHPEEAAHSNPVALFEGQMTARIHEADGTPYEHVFDINSVSKKIEVPFNTKYKRVRRNTKRFQARQAAAAAAAMGDQDAAEAMTMLDLGFSCSMWEDEAQREKWRVADWTEEDEKIMSQAPHEWIRMDADFEWLSAVYFQQPDFMWVSQLERDRDVVAQVAAIQALAQLPNPISSSMLTRTVLVPKYFFRVRIEAANALVSCAVPEHQYLGLFHLLMLFRSRHCHEPPAAVIERLTSLLDVPCIPRANDFSDLADYFVQRALVAAISRVRNPRGRTLPAVKRFLINVLRYNDNSTNKFVDDFYVAGAIEALASAFVPVESHVHGGFVPASEDPDAVDDDDLLFQARYEVERFRELDKLVPSYHNVITMAALDFNASLALVNLQPVDLPMYLSYTRQGSFAPVRSTAFNCLLLLRGLQHKVITRYLFAVLRTDESRLVKRALARAICEALAVAVSAGDFSTASLLEEGGMDDLDGEQGDGAVDSKLKPLRRDLGRSAGVREGFLSALLAPDADMAARWALLKFADLLFKPCVEREVPFQQQKLSIRVRMPSLGGVLADDGAQATPTATRIKLKSADASASEAPSTAEIAPADDVAVQASGPRVSFSTAAQAKPAPATKVKAPRPRKAKPLDVAQTSGMSPSDLTVCRSLLKDLFDDRRMGKHSTLFRHPVDPVRDHAPNYFNVIENPMDLSSIKDKLNAGMYKDRFEFKGDIELMTRNAKTFTPAPTARVHRDALALEDAFMKRWAGISKTIAQTEAKARAGAAAASAAAEAQAAVEEPAPPAVEPAPAPPVSAESSPVRATPAEAPAAPKPKIGLKLKLKPKPAAATASSPPPPRDPTPPPRASSSEPSSPEEALAASAPRAASPEKAKKGDKKRATPAKPAKAAAAMSPADPSAGPSFRRPARSRKECEADPVATGRGEPIHFKQSKTLLANLKKKPESEFFRFPVDAAALPTYYEEIEHPMDLQTMEKKLVAHEYIDMAQFAEDFLLIVRNAHQFNPPGTAPAVQADALERIWRREFGAAMVRRMDDQEKSKLSGMLTRLGKVHEAQLFLKPVDTTLLPNYFTIIRKEDARDLSLIAAKLKEQNAYDNPDALADDVRLMLQNCYRFNEGNDEVLEWARAFEQAFEREYALVREILVGGAPAQGTKRKAGAAAGAGASKKSRG